MHGMDQDAGQRHSAVTRLLLFYKAFIEGGDSDYIWRTGEDMEVVLSNSPRPPRTYPAGHEKLESSCIMKMLLVDDAAGGGEGCTLYRGVSCTFGDRQ
jgi:hypothetical protein